MDRKLGWTMIGLVAAWATVAQGQAFKVDGGTSVAAGFKSVDVAGGPLNQGVVVYAVVGPHLQEQNSVAVWGDSGPLAGYGIGGYFSGGNTGVDAAAGGDQGGSGNRTGVAAWAYGGDSAIGVRGEAIAENTQGKTAYGLWGTASCDGGTDCTSRAVYASGDLEYTGQLLAPSPLQFKESLAPLERALPPLLELEVVSFEYIQPPDAHMQLPRGPQVGFVAEQVAQVLPELVAESVHPAGIDRRQEDGAAERMRYLSIKPLELIPYLVRAIQEQQAQIDALEAELRPLRTRLAATEPARGGDEALMPASF